MKKEMHWLKSLSKVTREDRERIENIYFALFDDKSKTNWSCPACVRQTVNEIKNKWKRQYIKD